MKRSAFATLLVAGALALGGQSALAAGDAAKGEKVYKKCKACHEEYRVDD